MITKLDKKQLTRLTAYGSFDSSKQSCGCVPTKTPQRQNDIELLRECYDYWQSFEKTRKERRRNLKYRNGDQWGDYVADPQHKGRCIKEEALLSRDGKIPLKYNFIQQITRNVTGQMLSSPSQSIVYARNREDVNLSEVLTNALQKVHQLNQVETLNVSALEELLLCGMVCSRIHYNYWTQKDRCDVKVDMVNLNRLFFNTDIEDSRMIDLNLIGQIHDYTTDELIANFAYDRQSQEQLTDRFALHQLHYLGNLWGMSSEKLASIAFFASNDPSKHRVYEVWKRRGRWVSYAHDHADGTHQICHLSRAEVDAINKERLEMAQSLQLSAQNIPLVELSDKYEYYWEVSFLCADGAILLRSESPFAHNEHPYIITTVPMIDGEFRAVISDIVDIQRYINRLLVMIDFIIGSSAKGVLMVPESAIPDGYSIDDFTQEYVKSDGVIVYRPSPTREIPYQINKNSTNIGAWEMINMQMGLMQQVSGLSGAIQGQHAPANTPSSLYAQQSVNSQINYRSLFETLRNYQTLRDEKIVKTILQYYREPRYISIAGSGYNDNAVIYRPELLEEITDFNLVISHSLDTPVFRQVFDDILMDMLRRGYINLDIFLKNSSLPFADKLLMQIQQEREPMNKEEKEAK